MLRMSRESDYLAMATRDSHHVGVKGFVVQWLVINKNSYKRQNIIHRTISINRTEWKLKFLEAWVCMAQFEWL
jgi:hypothetical protein